MSNFVFSVLFESQIVHPLLPFVLLTTENKDHPNQFFEDHLYVNYFDQIIIKMQTTLH